MNRREKSDATLPKSSVTTYIQFYFMYIQHQTKVWTVWNTQIHQDKFVYFHTTILGFLAYDIFQKKGLDRANLRLGLLDTLWSGLKKSTIQIAIRKKVYKSVLMSLAKVHFKEVKLILLEQAHLDSYHYTTTSISITCHYSQLFVVSLPVRSCSMIVQSDICVG